MKVIGFGAIVAAVLCAVVCPVVQASDHAAKSFGAICDKPPVLRSEGGPLSLRPGRFFNPRREGQGWDFFWYGPPPGSQGATSPNASGNRLFVVWYTHEWNGSVLRPVWYGAVSNDIVWNEANTTLPSWSGRLYRFKLFNGTGASGNPTTFRQWLPRNLGDQSGDPALEFATHVGNVELFFGSGLSAGGRPSQVAARWQLNENYPVPASFGQPPLRPLTDDCLTNFIADSSAYNPDYTSSGVYLDRSASGWFWTPVYWTEGAGLQTTSHEHHVLAYFDAPGDPRWIVGFPQQNVPTSHVCHNFVRFQSSFPTWPNGDVMCMTGVAFNNANYAPWLLDEAYELRLAAAMRRTLNVSSTPAPTGSIALREVNNSGLTIRGSFLESGNSSSPASVVKVIGLTRALIVGPGISLTLPATAPDSVCRVADYSSRTPGTCDAFAHWSTEGAYLNLTVRLARLDTTPPRPIEFVRGQLRSSWTGSPLSQPLPVNGNSVAMTGQLPTSGPLVGERVQLQVFESPMAPTALAVSKPYTISPPGENRCDGTDGTSRPMAFPPVNLALASTPDGGGVQVTATIPAQQYSYQRPTGIRFRLYEATQPGPQVVALVRYLDERQFGVPQTIAARTYSAAFNGLDAGKQYSAIVDSYNECGFLSTQATQTVALTTANVPDQTLTESPPPVTNHDPSVGIVPHTSGVSGGAATFDFPIEVPPGIQGMQPSLSLSYSSRAGNSIAGMGVSLSGLSSIHRCPQTRATDGRPRAVDFSNNDRLCLDGQRLIVTGSVPYGQQGATYRTEIDQYLRVTQVSGDLALNSRSATFRVELKSGEILYFGGSADTSVWYVPVATAPGGVVNAALSWVIRRRANRAGNFVDYRYQDYGSGELLPSSIQYSGAGSTEASGGAPGTRQVSFTYESRPDPNNSYIGGAETRQTKRLREVKSFIGADQVRIYSLGFGTAPSAATGRTLLRDIQVCARDSMDKGAGMSCLPRTAIAWQEQGLARNLRRIVAEGTVAAAFPYTPPQYLDAYRRGGNSGAPPAPVYSFEKVGDLDGDGTVEHLAESSIPIDPSSIRSRLVRYSADRQVTGAIVLSAEDAERLYISANGRVIDLNNDGRSDIWYRGSRVNPGQRCFVESDCALSVAQWIPGSTWPNPTATPPPPLETFFTQRVVNFIDAPGAQPNPAIAPPPFSGSASTLFVDVTGDGLPELFDVIVPISSNASETTCALVAVGGTPTAPVRANGPELRVYENLSQVQNVQFRRAPILRLCIPAAQGMGDFWSTQSIANSVLGLQDVNGDGLPDLKLERRRDPVQADEKLSEIAFGSNSTGAFAFVTPVKYESMFSDGAARLPALRSARFGDFNGDGLQDIHVARACTYSGNTNSLTHLISFNSGRTSAGNLFTKFFAAPASNGAVANLDQCGAQEYEPNPMGPSFFAVADTDSDGRDEVLYPVAFALRQCNWHPDPQFVAPPGKPPEFYIYICPEGIRGSSPPPPDAGFNPGPYLNNLYFSGYGSFDGSLYVARASRFTIVTDSGGGAGSIPRIREDFVPFTTITNRDGLQQTDLFGDSLADSVVRSGCALLNHPTGANCVRANDLRDSANVPVVSGSYYVLESRGVAGNPDDVRSLTRSPLLPDLVWEVKAAAATGHVDSSMRIARWSYDPLSSSAGRVPNDRLPELYSLPANLQGPPAHFYFTSSMPVVAAYWESNGNIEVAPCGASQQCMRHGFIRRQFGYREALYSAEGRGFRGFRTIIEQVDGLSPSSPHVVTPGQRTTTVFKQSFPLSSALECQFVTSTADPVGPLACPNGVPPEGASYGGTTLLRASTAETEALLRGCSQPGTSTCYWDVQNRRQSTVSYEPTSGQVLSKKDVSLFFDNYGNEVQRSTVVEQIDGAGRTVTQREDAFGEYSPVESPGWFVNRLDEQITRKHVSYIGYVTPPIDPGESIQMSTGLFAYDFNPANGAGTRQVDCAETYTNFPPSGVPCGLTGAANPDWQSRVSTAVRDAFGNPMTVRTQLRTTTATNAQAQTRMAYADWGDGYFKVSEWNHLQHLTCLVTDPRFGAPSQVSRPMVSGQTCSNPGTLVERTTYDAFGRAVRVRAPQADEIDAGTNTLRTIKAAQDIVVSRQWCTVSGGAQACTNIPLPYRELKEQHGSPRQETYFDVASRPRVTGTTASGAGDNPGIPSLISTSTSYDDLGRELGVYGPRNGAAYPEVDYLYDRFGRLRVKLDKRARLDGASGFQHLATTYTANRATVNIRVRACNLVNLSSIRPDDTDPVQCTPIVPAAGTQTQTDLTMSRVMDPAGRPLVTVDANGGTTVFQYDGAGNPTYIRDAAQVITTATYDALGRRRTVNDPNQGASTFEYNGVGELVSSRNERGLEVKLVRDSLGRVAQRTWLEPAGVQQSGHGHYGIDRYDYDVNGFGLLWRERRDVYSSPVYIDPVSPGTAPRVEQFERSMLFDPLYRTTSVTVQMGQPASQYTTAPSTYVTRTRYDGVTGRVKQRIFPRGVSIGYAFNKHGYLDREFQPGTSATSHYRKVLARDAYGNETRLSLDSAQLRRQFVAASTSGLTERVCYDFLNPDGFDVCANGSPLKVEYRYDAFGNVIRQQLLGGRPSGTVPLEETYRYDKLHRVTNAQYADGVSPTPPIPPPIAYDYSATGNLLMKTDFSVASTSAYTYGTENRATLSKAGPNAVESVALPGSGCKVDYRYDGSGNQIAQEFAPCGINPARRQWIDYTIDNLPKYMQIVNGPLPTNPGAYPSPAGLWSQFRYSPDGQRYSQTVSMGNVSRSTTYLGEYEREEIIGGTDPYIEHRYTLAPGVLLISREGNTLAATDRSGVYYILGDRLGSTSIVLRQRDRAIVGRHGFGPFGEPRDGNWLANATRTLHAVQSNADLTAVTRRGFTQHEHLDRHSLIHMNGRLYDYLAGRFLGVDPIIQFPTNSQSLNPYSYLMNSPFSGTDPTGYCQAETGTRIKTCVQITLTFSSGRVVTDSFNLRSSRDMERAANIGIVLVENGASGGFDFKIASEVSSVEVGAVRKRRENGSSADIRHGEAKAWEPPLAFLIPSYEVASFSQELRFYSAVADGAGTTYAAWMAVFDKSGGYQNPFSGRWVGGTDAWDERFLGVVGLSAGRAIGTIRPWIPTIDYRRSDIGAISANIEKAIELGKPSVLTRLDNRRMIDRNRRDSLRGHPSAGPGQSRDEYPFASTYQGGRGSAVANVPEWEQDFQGALMMNFYKRYGIRDGDQYRVRVID